MQSVVTGKHRGSSGRPCKGAILPAVVPVVRQQRAGVTQGWCDTGLVWHRAGVAQSCSGEGRTDSAHTHIFSRGAACQLPNVYFKLLAVDISLDYFSYSIPNCSKGIASEL